MRPRPARADGAHSATAGGAPSAPAGASVSGAPSAPAGASVSGCRIREILDRVGDKWSLFVISCLGDGPKRFTHLKQSVDGISQRMLTVTLRGLERDGIVRRTVYPVMPPRVDYELTPLGRTLLDATGALIAWADAHLDEVDQARASYDARPPAAPVPALAWPNGHTTPARNGARPPNR